MAEAAIDVGAPAARETVASRIVRYISTTPVHIVLALLGLFWLVPTIGLMFTSLLSPENLLSKGWWQIFSTPSKATFDNYQAIFENDTITKSLITTLQIAIGGTILPLFVGAMAGYAFAWLDFPGRDWFFILVIALLVVPLQMALIPIFSLYDKAGLFDSVLGLILFHTAFGLPFAIFLLRNFFIGIPKDLMEAARIDGASEVRIFLRVILPLGMPALASLAIFQFLWTWNDLLVGAHARAGHPADHGRDLLAAPRVQLQHRADRAGDVHLADHPARRVLRLPALLRRGPARRLGQVRLSTWTAAWRSSAVGSAASSRMPRCATPASSRARSRSSPRRPIPPAAWRRKAAAIRQRLMRSESDGHCYPTSFPGLAPREAVRQGSLGPLARTLADRYRPSVEVFLRHVDELRAETGWDESVGSSGSSACAPPTGGFELDDHGDLPSRPARSRPPRPRRSARAARTTRGSSMPTSRTSTAAGSPSSARGWRRRRSG